VSIASLSGDLDSIIAHAGVAVTIGVTSDYGILRTEEITVVGADGQLSVIGTQLTLTVREGKFSGLGQDVAVTANGSSYKIRSPGKPKPDGTRKMVLVEASP